MTGVEAELEAATLDLWTTCSSVLDVASLYDTLRGSLTLAQAEYQAARAKGWRGQARADQAAAEIRDLTVLLDVVADELDWRRGRYLATGRAWPLGGCLLWPASRACWAPWSTAGAMPGTASSSSVIPAATRTSARCPARPAGRSAARPCSFPRACGGG